MGRSLENWVDGFVELTAHLPSPELLKKWSAIACISGALERRTWVHTMNAPLYPNLYIILVVPPGIGKTILATRVAAMWRSVKHLHVGPSSLTKAAFIDTLNESARTITLPKTTPPTETFHGLQLSINELGVLLPQYDGEFMNVLTDLYDCNRYEERRRGKDLHIELDKTQLTLYACTTPSYLNELLPEGAWDQGFISRCILIYSGEQKKTSLFAKATADEALGKKLIRDLQAVGKLQGQFTFEPDAQEAIDQWHMTGNKPAPDHPKLAHYLTRRTTHALKLMMVASAAEGDSMVITKDNFDTALAWLLEAESFMPDIFKSMSSGGDTKIIKECWHYAFQKYTTDGNTPIPEHKIIQFLQSRAPSHNVERILSVMVKAQVFKTIEVNKLGTCYIPQPLEIT